MHLRTLISLLVLPACSSVPAEATPRPNFVFFLADDLGWRDLGCFGSTFYETPNLDRLARTGMRFTQAYAASPVCSPTRASILAGKHPARMDTTDYFGGRRRARMIPAPYVDRLPSSEVTLAERLRGAGYRTGFFGKWHLGRAPHTPQSQGFDVNAGGFHRGHPPAGYFSPYQNPALPDGPKGEYLTERLTEEALAFLDQAEAQPFLLYFSYYSVHTPLQARADRVARFTAKRDAAPPPQGPRWRPEGNRRCRQYQDHPVYASMVQHLDESVGRVLARLEELGLAEHTVVVFLSDNGGLSTSEGHPTSNLPLRAGKGWLYEGGIRVPMLVRWPGVTAPDSRCDAPVFSADVYPTFLEMAGLPLDFDQHVDGRSLAPLLRGDTGTQHPALFWHYPHYGNQGGSPGSAIRVGDYKLIEFHEPGADGKPPVELYDLARDPGETANLAPGDPVRVRDLRDQLHTWRHAVDAKMPTLNPEWRQKKE